MQTVLVVIVIATAILYLGLRSYKTWFGKSEKGCEKCAVQKERVPK